MYIYFTYTCRYTYNISIYIPVIITFKNIGFLVIFMDTLVVFTIEFEINSNIKKAIHISKDMSIGASVKCKNKKYQC